MLNITSAQLLAFSQEGLHTYIKLQNKQFMKQIANIFGGNITNTLLRQSLSK